MSRIGPSIRRLEQDAQAEVVLWASRVKVPRAPDVAPGAMVSDYLFAVPNGGARSKAEAAIFVGQGVKSGIPDLVLDLARGGFHGWRCEMKAPRWAFRTERDRTLALKAAQAERLAMLRLAGYAAEVKFGAAETIVFLADYLGIPIDPAFRRPDAPVAAMIRTGRRRR